jgi:hypothetical protein
METPAEGAPIEAKATKTSFVYDTRTGEIVHVHQFIPASPDGTCPDREMEETALKLAPAALDRAQLEVLHHDGEMDLTPEREYRVDVENRKLLVETAPSEDAVTRDRGLRS